MSLKGIFPIDKWNFNTQSVLKDMLAEEYEILTRNAIDIKYIKGQLIFREGSIPSGIYYIQRGKVKKYKVDNLGKEQIIYIANSGELIGYHAILASEYYPDSATALEESIISIIPKEDFLEVLDQSPLLSKRLLKTLSHEFGVLANNISIFTQRPVKERLAITLIVLREKFKKDGAEKNRIEINLSRDDIAGIVGTTREHVVRLLRKFKDEHLIETKGRKIWITDIRKIIDISNYK